MKDVPAGSSNEETARAIAQYIYKVATKVLLTEQINPEDRKFLEQAAKEFDVTFKALMLVIQTASSTEASSNDGPNDKIELVRDLMVKCFFIGASMGMTKEVGKHHKTITAALARAKRAQKPKVVAVREAVEATRGTGPSARPNQEAARILNPVNRLLKQTGVGEVKVDVVRRVLEKFPRS